MLCSQWVYTNQTMTYNSLYNVLLVGCVGVGKGTMNRGICSGRFPPFPELEDDPGHPMVRTLHIEDKMAQIQIWITTGQEMFHSIVQQHYYSCHGIVLLYDITNSDSFVYLSSVYQDAQRNASKHAQIMVLGNKCDLAESRQVSTERGRLFASEHGLKFMGQVLKQEKM